MNENRSITQLEIRARPYMELIVYTSCVFASALALVSYCTKAILQFLSLFNLISAGTLKDGSLLDDWLFLGQTTSFDFVFVTGTFLALDRVLALTFPTKYAIWSLGRKCCFSVIILCSLTFGFLCGAQLLEYYLVNFFVFGTVLKSVGVVYDISATMEFFLHMFFFIQYRRFSKHSKAVKVSKANQISLLQSISQVVFYISLKLIYRVNTTFFNLRISWMYHITWYYQLTFSLHILICSVFIISKLKSVKKVNVVNVGMS
ncbi:hypothetical protein L596_008740 [Steinernema carpocapsae]|uniref:7TM GPCR serpentine receptor class x (Srx) domain-containing protein n=1 Tax=Steinernema carpocapsae TaxID=34508 RepID=A0A4U5PEI3_STECR|nr:hypothetical protein L596_008740 [Steinernema carpocapsae]